MSPLRNLLRAKHPTAEQAAEALAQASCMYAALSACSGSAASVGLADDDDPDAVLVCKAHYGRLRQLDERDREQLRRHLRQTFMREVSVG